MLSTENVPASNAGTQLSPSQALSSPQPPDFEPLALAFLWLPGEGPGRERQKTCSDLDSFSYETETFGTSLSLFEPQCFHLQIGGECGCLEEKQTLNHAPLVDCEISLVAGEE